MATVWVLKPPPQLVTEDIDGLLVCYSGRTGRTHMLDAFPAEIVRSLSRGQKTASEIKLDLAVLIDEEGDGWLDKIGAVLEELQRLHLVDSHST